MNLPDRCEGKWHKTTMSLYRQQIEHAQKRMEFFIKRVQAAGIRVEGDEIITTTPEEALMVEKIWKELK